jgi:hypothetical protein
VGLVDVIAEITRLKCPANDAAEIACADHLLAVAIQQGKVHRVAVLEGKGLLRQARADFFRTVVVVGANR